MASSYTVRPLPRKYWRGTTVEEWGLEIAQGRWLTWPPNNRPAGFVSEASAQRYADQRDAAKSARDKRRA